MLSQHSQQKSSLKHATEIDAIDVGTLTTSPQGNLSGLRHNCNSPGFEPGSPAQEATHLYQLAEE